MSTATSSEVPRRAFQRRNRTEEVLSVAIRLIASRGYVATSMQDVADGVGLLKGSLYYYFPAKEDLLLSIFENAHTTSEALSAEIEALGLEPGDELFEYLRRTSTVYLENIDRTNIYFNEARHLTGWRRDKVHELSVVTEERVQNRVRRAQEAGAITSAVPAPLLTTFIRSSTAGLRGWNRSLAGPFDNDVIVSTFMLLMQNTLQPEG